ncbi:uncharacterized protein LOC144471065 isoform X2 [Augochlora pura]
MKHFRFFDDQDRVNRDSFRKPIWQNDEDDDDMDDFRHSTGGVHFHIFSDPLEITKHFESQIDILIKSFFGFHQDVHDMFPSALPPAVSPTFVPLQEGNLREKMLKPNSDNFSEVTPKLDVDLDGQVTPDNFSNVWDKYNKPSESKSATVLMTRKEFTQKPDGTIEQKQIIKDNEGNEEITISRQIGNKLHTITTKKDKNGVETKTEDLVNIDESELKGNKWLPPNNGSSNGPNFNWSYFPWKQFFKPDPKL